MGLFVPQLNDFSFMVDNWGANPSDTPGTSVVPGTSNAEGTFTQVFTALAQDVYLIYLRVSDGATSTAIKKHLLDIGVDPAGGTSYVEIIPNIVCGGSGVLTSGPGHEFVFPFYIKAGSTVAVRIRGGNATPGTVRVGMKLYGQPSRPEMCFKGAVAQALGITEGSTDGTSFTPGNAADGTWVSLGTISGARQWVQLGYQINNATVTAESTYIDLGVGDATNKRVLQRVLHRGTTTEAINTWLDADRFLSGYHDLPSGAELWVRGRCVNAPDTGYQAGAVAIGG